MSLSHGRPYLAIPGPSVLPDAVLAAMMRPSPNIYAGELVELTHGLVPDLRRVAGTAHHVAMYISNGHGLWEAAITNSFSRGDKVLVPVTGAFGSGWAQVARALALDVEVVDFGKDAPFDLAVIRDVLSRDKDHKIKGILAVHTDTSASVRNDIKGLRSVMDKAGHPALLMADCIASLGCDPFYMDDWGVDVMIAASQKGLMTPAGMGFVFFNDKAMARGAGASLRTPYWDWTQRAAPEYLYQFFDGTAPTHHLFALRAALDLIKAEGMDAIYARHALIARAYWAAIDAWGQGGSMRHNIADPAYRSHAVTTVCIDAPQATAIREWAEEKAGLTLGISLGMRDPGDPAWHGFFRIGHMGHVNAHMVLGVVGVIDAAMKALGIPHGDGAMAAASAVIATA